MSLLKLLLCIVVAISIVQVVTAQNTAASRYVRLVNSNSTTGSVVEGTLQVYLQGRWSTVCDLSRVESAFYSLSNIATLYTACRQLGYTNMKNIITVPNPPVDSTVIMGINCSLVFDQSINGEEFLQRCKIGRVQYFDPDVCISVVGVQCDNTKAPYTGQVRTVDKGEHSSLLEIYNEEWRPLCVRNYQMNDFVANSLCRQMGFTSSSQYLASNNTGTSWKINLQSEDICNGDGELSNPHPSYACFTICIDIVVNFTAVDDCGIGHTQFELICKFDMGEQLVYSGGNPLACKYKEVQIPSSVNVDVDVNPVNYAMIAGLSVASFIIMILVVVLIVQCYAFYCRRHCMMTEGPRYRVVTETTVNDDL